MKMRRIIILLFFVLIFTSVNVFFHSFEFWTPLLIYIAIVNGGIMGFLAGNFCNKIFVQKEIKKRFAYVGVIVSLLLTLLWVNNQISVEFYINRENLHQMPPYIDYFRFYLIGLSLGIVKSFYYAIVPSIAIFTAIGFLFDKFVVKKSTN